MSATLRIDVFFDFICPWCLIGKRHLERALDLLRIRRPDVKQELAWHGVQLLPHLPPQGVPFAEFYRQRLGSAEAVRMRQAQVQQAAADAGLSLDLSGIDVMPNTATAHRLLQHASALGGAARRNALLEKLFDAYFHDGKNLADPAVLLDMAQECGYPQDALADCLSADATPLGDNGMPARGVPYFIFNRRIEVSGSQPPQLLLQAMEQALEQDTNRSPSL